MADAFCDLLKLVNLDAHPLGSFLWLEDLAVHLDGVLYPLDIEEESVVVRCKDEEVAKVIIDRVDVEVVTSGVEVEDVSKGDEVPLQRGHNVERGEWWFCLPSPGGYFFGQRSLLLYPHIQSSGIMCTLPPCFVWRGRWCVPSWRPLS